MSGVQRVGAAVLAGLLAAPVLGADYYVDRSHPGASDFNAGSEAAPWLSIGHAATVLQPGDTAWVKAGTYPEHVVPTVSGSAGAEIALRAYPGHTVTIDGSSIALAAYSALVELQGLAHFRVSGFRVVNAGPAGTSAGIGVGNSAHIVIEGNQTSDTAASGILVWSSSDVVVSGNEVTRAMTAGSASENECITVGRTAGFEIVGNHVHDSPPPGVDAARGEGIDAKDGSSNGSVHHNHVHHVPSVGIYVDAWTEHTFAIDVYNNRVHDVDGDGIVLASEQGGLLKQVRVFNNLVHDNRWLGISLSDCCIAQRPLDDIQIVNNTLFRNGWDAPPDRWGGGLAHANDQATGVVVRNNIVAGNLSFQIALEGPAAAGVTVDHNLVDGFRGYPGEIRGTDYQEGDPGFANAAGLDFHLTEGSIAIDAGSALLAPAFDFDNGPRPLGSAPDIGAFEATTVLFADGFEARDAPP